MEIYLNNEETLTSALLKVNPFDIIHLANKKYNEKIKITTNDLTIIGHGNDCEIVNKDYYNKIHNDNKEFLTVRTYTVMVAANNVTIKDVTIKNASVPNSIYGQAVALHVFGDNFLCENCRICGAQDTILSGPIPYDLTLRYKNFLPKDELSQIKSHQLYTNCYIEGDVDFIFGCGIAIFQNCEIHSIGKGYICAPSHPKEYEFGFVFLNCDLTSSTDNIDNVYLGRPWRDYGQAAFINCKAEKHIKKEGFHYWNVDRAKTCRLSQYNTIDSLYMPDFAKTLTTEETKKYSIQNILKN